MKRLCQVALGTGAVFLSLAGTTQAADTGRTLIVMDGSGSMWGQIDGVPKLEIARNAVADLVDEISPGRALGLVAYGHRSRGDCSDIEVMVEPAPGTAAAVLDAVNTMRFQGRTPLSDAVRIGAEALRITENPATLVLVTDGLETCGADPCALGAELEAAGIDFTAHVVGFGLSKEEGAQVACLAENTGGRYIEARNADSLSSALAEAVLKTERPPEKPVSDIPPASLDAPATAPITSAVEVGWTGPADPDDYIDIVPADIPTARPVTWAYVRDGNPARVKMPANPGEYLLRYVWTGASREAAAASQPITVTEADFAIDAPLTVELGTMMSVNWNGPGNDEDYLDTVEAGSPRTESELTYVWVRDGNPALIQAPSQPGEYDLRYIVQGPEAREIGIAVPLRVTETTAMLEAPPAVRPGADFPVRFRGPKTPGDWVDIVTPGFADFSGEITYFYAQDTRNDEETLFAPETPGDYELRYVLDGQDGRKVLYRLPLAVAASAPARTELAPRMDADADVVGEGPDAGEGLDEEGLGEDVGFVCDGPELCLLTDESTGLSFALPPGWITDFPYPDEEAGGDSVRLNMMPRSGDGRIALNPNPLDSIADGMCVPVAAGRLCVTPQSDMAAFSAVFQAMLTAPQPIIKESGQMRSEAETMDTIRNGLPEGAN